MNGGELPPSELGVEAPDPLTLVLTLDIEGRDDEIHEILVRAGETGTKVIKLKP